MRKEQYKKIRVALIVASLDILGGQAVAALRLREGLSASGEIEAELIPINPRLPKGLRWLQRIKYVRTLVTFLYYLANLICKLPRFDVVHAFSASNFSFLLAPAPAVIIGKLYGKRVILNYHSGEAEQHLKNWPKTIATIMPLVDRIIVPSGFLVGVFSNFGFAAEAISNTVDLSRFCFHKRDRLRPIIFTNRNFEDHYNVACAIRAFAFVQRQIPEARLIVAGNGSQKEQLFALAKQLQLQHLEFVGAVEPEQMPGLYQRADIYLNSSEIDNMPLSILEAFACGLVVVTTNAGGIPFVVKDGQNGLLVNRGDHEGLAQKIIGLLEQPDFARQLIRQARTDCQQYTWDAVRSRWISLYQSLTGKIAAQRAITNTQVSVQNLENEWHTD